MKLSLAPGSVVRYGAEEYVITAQTGLDTVLARSCETGRLAQLRTAELCAPPVISQAPTQLELSLIDDKAWLEARRRYHIIEPLLDGRRRTREMVQARSRETGTARATIYRWIAQYELAGEVSALRPIGGRSRRGESRLAPETEAIIKATIGDYYQTAQRHSIEDTIAEIVLRCQRGRVPPPSNNTVRNRINALPAKDRLERSGRRKQASDTLTLKPGRFGEGCYPLALVEIDHTQLDVFVVDEFTRRPLIRPWLTLAMDVFSRVVTGFYIGLNKPDAASVGLCIAHSILPKEQYLAQLNLATSWPVYGVPDAIHLDNARELRGNTLRRACEKYHITINFRPVRRPSYGAHIERLLGTLLGEIHGLPGSTFSNPTQRAEYDSEAEAALTLQEFERWFTQLITGTYHLRPHAGIGGIPPLQLYEEGILGSTDRLGRGLPDRLTDAQRLRLDFMPYFLRKIQPTGVVIDRVHYLHDVFADYLSRDGNKRHYVFRRDPRDISAIYFWDEQQERYITVPYRDTSMSPMSLWEMREALKHLKRQGARPAAIDERAIFESRQQLKQIEDNAIHQTKRQRRSRQQRLQLATSYQERETPAPRFGRAPIDVGEVQPFEEIDW